AVGALPTTPTTGVTVKVAGAPGAAATEFKVLKILEIKADGLPKGGVQQAVIAFQLTLIELETMGLAPEDVSLLHKVGDKWEELPTTFKGVSDGVYSFEGVTDSFSYFAIAGKAPPAVTVEEKAGSLVYWGLGVALVAAVIIGAAVVLKRQGKL
ncbi:MAG TPA: PGF-pre-PGF domain-containing protein, partial [Candidatus Thermoplasmatota archaeon]|nr:PGF-pre-PGF domain-containing protein [Candidatus Thermoplasmatota archaeon]